MTFQIFIIGGVLTLMNPPLSLIDSSTERTTAVTDAILSGLALGGGIYLLRLNQPDYWKAGLWAGAFGLLALAAALGAIAHGFKMSPAANRRWWYFLNFALSLTIAFFVVGVSYDLGGLATAQVALPVMIAMGTAFGAVTLFFPGRFIIFILYEAIAMLLALGAYGWLAVTGPLPGAGWMATGVLVNIIAAGVQAGWDGRHKPITFIWQFDQNGLYHLIQMVGVIFLLVGLHLALPADMNP